MMHTDKYDDIIDLPHPEPQNNPRMSMQDRAAQFSPFSALTGYEEAVMETARLTDEMSELTDDAKLLIDKKLQLIKENLDCLPMVKITFFLPDKRKKGGKYVTVRGIVSCIDEYQKSVIMKDKTVIMIERIRNIEGRLFENIL